jgi:hypothetical protein
MISWIVATDDRNTLEANLSDTLQFEGADELVVVDDPPSIAAAFNQGSKQAVNEIRCYVHDDVRILDWLRLRGELLKHCRSNVGLVGVIGSRIPAIPWWLGERCGSIDSTSHGRMDYGSGGVSCSYLDGVLLATVQDIAWDESYGGFHFYDYDSCMQMLDRGLQNYCLPNGAELVFHNADIAKLTGERPLEWNLAAQHFVEKWT